MNTIKWKIAFWAIVIVVLGFVLSGLIGCSSINKATQRVMTNESAFNKVGGEWARLNPCQPDTPHTIQLPPVYIKGKDSSFPVFIPVPGACKFKLDTTIKGVHVKIDSVGGLVINIPANKPDTVKLPSTTFQTDTRAVKMATDSLNSINLQFSNYKAAMQVKLDEAQNKAKRRGWWLTGIIAAAALFFGIKAYSFFAGGGAASFLSKVKLK